MKPKHHGSSMCHTAFGRAVLAPEMDAIFRELRPGKELKLKLIFSDKKNDLLTPEAFKIKRGSAYFYSEAGYFRLDSKGKVYSNPDGLGEVDLESFYTSPQGVAVPCQDIDIDYSRIMSTKSSKALRLKMLPVRTGVDNGEYVCYITVRLSEDFEGEVIGWRSCHGI